MEKIKDHNAWFRRVEALEQEVSDLKTCVASFQLVLDASNTALKKYVFYIYGHCSENPAENLEKLTKWVLQVREEFKKTKERLTVLEAIDEQVIALAEKVSDLDERLMALENKHKKETK